MHHMLLIWRSFRNSNKTFVPNLFYAGSFVNRSIRNPCQSLCPPNVNSSDQLAPGGAIYDADNQPTLTQQTRLTILSPAYQLATPKLNRSNDDRLLNFTNYWNHFHAVCNVYSIVTQILEDVVIYCTLQQKSAQENQVKYVALCRYCTAVPLFSCEIKFKKY